jgi:hypothetical protein
MSFAAGAPASAAPEAGGAADEPPVGGATGEPEAGAFAELEAEADALDEAEGEGALTAGASWGVRFCKPSMTPHPTSISDRRTRMTFLRTGSPHH